MGLEEKEESPWDVLRRVSDSGVTKYIEEESTEVKPEEETFTESVINWFPRFNSESESESEEVYDPENNRSNEAAIKFLTEGREKVKSWLSILNDESTEEQPTEAPPTEVKQTDPNVKPVDIETKRLLSKADTPALTQPTYPNVLDSNKAIHGRLWGRAFHTEAEYDSIKQADYVDDVRQFLVPNSNYVNTMVPILNRVVPAFAGDSGVKGDILYRAMLEIGAHESQGATDLYNKKSHASGVFQTLTSTVRDTAKDSDYYGPKAQKLTGKSREEVANMTAVQIQNWMQTDFTANAVFGAIELIKLAKGLENIGEGDYLLQLTGPPEDKTDWANAIT